MIEKLMEAFFDVINHILSSIPSLPDIPVVGDLESFLSDSNIIAGLQMAYDVMNYFCPMVLIGTLIGFSILLNNYKTIMSAFYRLKHIVPFW